VDSLLLSAESLGLWIGFVLSLLAFSALFGDHVLARLAQHILVGAALGYLLVLAVQNVLRPRIVDPLLLEGEWTLKLLVPLVLGTLLLASGLEVTLRARDRGPNRIWQRGLQRLGMAVVVLMVGVGLATATVGAIQGTLLPQVAAAASWTAPAALEGAAAAVASLTGLLMLLIATGVLLHLYVEPASRRSHVSHALGHPLAQRVLAIWTWLGKRALWLAAGFLFARLVAARLSLLIAQFEYFAQILENIAAVW
jgi:hypothetical protein